MIVELDQSNRIAIYTAESSKRNQYNEINEFFVENSDFVTKLRTKAPELTDSEAVKAHHIALMVTNNWMDAEFAYQSDLISERTFEESFIDMRASLARYPGLIPIFEELLTTFSSSHSDLRSMQTLRDIIREGGP